MSFSRTGLGAGRRLDHNSFINGKNAPTDKSPTKQSHQSVNAYSYAAPELPTTQRNPSPTRPSTSNRKNHPSYFTSPPKLKEYDPKDTSVNIATAFNQAALSEMPISTTSRGKGSQTNGPSKSSFSGVVSDSDNDEAPQEVDSKGRPLSKANPKVAAVRSNLDRALSPAAFYVRQRSKDPEDHSQTLAAPQRSMSRESSYDYTAEQSHYEELLNKARNQRASREPTPDHSLENSTSRGAVKRHKPRVSRDAQAYKPGQDEDEDEDYESDDGRKGRRKKKKDESAGRLTNLPTVGYSKKRKGTRKSRGGPETIDEEPENDESTSFNETGGYVDDSAEMNPFRHPSPQPMDDMPSADMSSVNYTSPDTTKEEINYPPPPTRRRSRSRSLPREVPPSRPFISPGAILGSIVRMLTVAIGSTLAFVLRSFLFLVKTPMGLLIVFSVFSALLYQAGLYPSFSIPSIRFSSPYRAPDIPASTVDDFITRLREVELALADMTRRHDQLQSLYDRERKVSSTSAQRISLLENKLETEMKSSAELIEGVRKTSLSQISGINDEIKILKESTSKPADTSKLEEAVATVRSRVDGVENTVKDVLEHVRSNPKTGSSSASSWWSTSSWKSGISIKTSDGKDVTALIASMVQSAIVQYSKDIVGKRDFALGSSGGKVIPTWTTSSYTHSPSSWSSAILGWPLGVGRTPGRPPVSALHHELSQGYCWPFAGSSGQLGVLLARQVYISEFTIDHIASELAFNLRSAPKDIEVWALVEGADNLAKYRTYQEVKKLQREREEQFAKDHGTAPPPPENVWNGAPKGTYMQIGNFTYDIHAPHHIQTFAVAPEIQAAGIDFGIVVFRFRSNWGDNRFTCIYRVRVHGVEANGPEPLLPPETEESS